MSGTRSTRFLVGLSLVASLGCASIERTFAGSASRSEEVRALKQRIIELEKRATMAEVEVEHLRRLLSGTGNAVTNGEPAENSPEAESPSAEIIEVQAEDDAEIAREQLPALVGGTKVDVEVSDLEPVVLEEPDGAPDADTDEPFFDSASVSAGTVVEPAVLETVEAGATAARVTEDAQMLYDRGYTFYHQGRYLDAETAFQQFLAAHGETDLADNAQFWIGEARYARDDLAGALAAYREVASKYPAGNKVPDSLLKSAECLRGLGDLEGAVRGYREVIDRYPSTAAAAVAEDQLRNLD